MTKTLSTLVKVQQHEVDAQRRAVVELEENLQRMQEALASHLELMAREREAARQDIEAARALPVWLNEAIVHERRLRDQIRQFEAWIVEAREELQRRYEDLKKFEIALEAEQKRLAAERLRDEQIMLDEIAGQRAGRDKKGE